MHTQATRKSQRELKTIQLQRRLFPELYRSYNGPAPAKPSLPSPFVSLINSRPKSY